MRSSAISSATATSPSRDAPPPRSFALTGRSHPLDPRTNAVRADIADIRLAQYVFAPHYVAAVERCVVTPAALRDARHGGAVIAQLAAGERFELLDDTGGTAWGIASARGLVGYIDADALEASG